MLRHPGMPLQGGAGMHRGVLCRHPFRNSQAFDGKCMTCCTEHCPKPLVEHILTAADLAATSVYCLNSTSVTTSKFITTATESFIVRGSCPIVRGAYAQCAVPKILHACSVHACILDQQQCAPAGRVAAGRPESLLLSSLPMRLRITAAS